MNTTKKKKSVHKKDEALTNDIKFCTECNDDLNNFDIDPMLKTKKDVIANHENCKKTGKFKGDKCSKLFITEEDDVPLPEEDEEDII